MTAYQLLTSSDSKIRFNRTNVANLKLAVGKPYQIIWDDSLPGFGVRINPTAKVWVVQYRAKGKSRRQTIGRVDAISLEAARETARTLLARVQLGADPYEEKRESNKRRTVTFEFVMQRYLESAKPRLCAMTPPVIIRCANGDPAPETRS